jgi:hypothetical protein
LKRGATKIPGSSGSVSVLDVTLFLAARTLGAEDGSAAGGQEKLGIFHAVNAIATQEVADAGKQFFHGNDPFFLNQVMGGPFQSLPVMIRP